MAAMQPRRRLLAIHGVLVLIALGLHRPVLGVQASPINAGCYIAAPGACSIHVDPFTIVVSSGKRLTSFKLLASGSPIYQFATDQSNPPLGTYVPSATKMDYAVTCGRTYDVTLQAKDSGDATSVQVGSVTGLVCPTGDGWLSWIPTASTGKGTSRQRGSVTFNGVANAQGGVTQVTFEYGTTTAYGRTATATPSGFSDSADHQVSATIVGLVSNGTYHYRVVTQNAQGITYGADQVVRASGVNLVPILMLLLD